MEKERSNAMQKVIEGAYTPKLSIPPILSGEQKRRISWNMIKTFPGFLGYSKLRKSRARMMAALVADPNLRGHKGNLIIEFSTDPRPEVIDSFLFYYRETLIAIWYPLTNEFKDIPCGVYEDTASTRNQRKVAREAVEEFNAAVFGTC